MVCCSGQNQSEAVFWGFSCSLKTVMLWSNNYASDWLIKIPRVNIFLGKIDSGQNEMPKYSDLKN